MVEHGFMSQKDYYSTFSELKGGTYGCVDASLLWFVRFCKCAVSSKGLGLTQSKVDPCVFFKMMRNLNPKS